tara:strand:+ start:2213 stop:2437 length:225 start_codon:yes stop_codon:yes gene_type:complete
MSNKKVIIQYAFTVEQAAITRAKNPKAVLCDAQNFCYVNFVGANVVAGDDSAETAYLVAKAKGEVPKTVKKAKV